MLDQHIEGRILHQLINLLKGDMSLVGPRPLLVKYLPLYTERQARGSNTFSNFFANME